MLRKIIKNNIFPSREYNLNNIREYYDSEKFTDGLFIDVSTVEAIDSREQYIKNLVQGSKVLHLGFCDHEPLIEEKVEAGKWFHNDLIKSAELCVGIDIDKSAVEFVRAKYNLKNIYCDDILNPQTDVLKNDHFDYIILGEIIEHISNPYQFLENIHKMYKGRIKKIIITTPNAYGYYGFKYAKMGMEVINSDHKNIYSLFTLSRLLSNSGFHITNHLYAYRTEKLWHKMFNRMFGEKLLVCQKALSSTIIVAAEF